MLSFPPEESVMLEGVLDPRRLFARITQTTRTSTNNPSRARCQAGQKRDHRVPHCVGGLHQDLPMSRFEQILRGLKERFSSINLETFTAIAHYNKYSILSTQDKT